MVDVLGHLGTALLWAAPVWLFYEARISLVFIGLTVMTAHLPDVDLLLGRFLPVAHHGVTHTVVFVTAVALIAGWITVFRFGSWIERQWLKGGHDPLSKRGLYAFVTGAFLLGGYSHLFGDVLSAPDIAQPIEPLWPLVDKPWSVDVIWYSSPWWNSGLLLVALSIHLVLGYLSIRSFPRSHRAHDSP
jgi:membrane-bound metal-dependent hydrolase YbcI (DUF457 family)